MALSLHADSPLSDLRCCLYLQLSLRFFSAADTSRLLSLHYTTLSRFVHTTRFSPLCSLRLCVFNTALYSLLCVLSCQCSPAHHVALYPTLLCSFRTSRTIRLSFSFLLLLPCPSFSLRSLLSFSSLTLPLFRALLSSQPAVFSRLASHAFIHFFRRLILLRFYACHVFRFVSCLHSSLVSLSLSFSPSLSVSS